MLNEIRLKQSGSKEEAPVTRSKWNVQPKKDEDSKLAVCEVKAGGGLLDDTIISKDPFVQKDTVSEYTMVGSPDKSPLKKVQSIEEQPEAELIQADFKVKDEVKRKNSDSDCAYFSGPELNNEEEEPVSNQK